ncbi:MAG: hypothetical protein LQ342_003514 [Letrouitia transgressa]|nr:MAG: hypothetical protein LQ342_003514 [Letrouitia transgressa]
MLVAFLFAAIAVFDCLFQASVASGLHKLNLLNHRSLLHGSRATDPSASHYGTLTFHQTGNATRVTINNPPINLLDYKLISDLYDFLMTLQPAPGKTTPKVVIFSSANLDFFISHFDLRALRAEATPDEAKSFDKLISSTRLLQSITSTAFIAEIDGRTNGGGQELSSQMDMRFAGPNAVIAQWENSCGFVATAGGQAFMGATVGKARAMEYLLASKILDGRTATRFGLVNNYYDSAQELRREVDALAARIGLFPQPALNDTKFSLQFLNPTVASLDEQIARFRPIAGSSASQAIVKYYLQVSNESNTAFEKGIPDTLVRDLYGNEPLADKEKVLNGAISSGFSWNDFDGDGYH